MDFYGGKIYIYPTYAFLNFTFDKVKSCHIEERMKVTYIVLETELGITEIQLTESSAL